MRWHCCSSRSRVASAIVVSPIQPCPCQCPMPNVNVRQNPLLFAGEQAVLSLASDLSRDCWIDPSARLASCSARTRVLAVCSVGAVRRSWECSLKQGRLAPSRPLAALGLPGRKTPLRRWPKPRKARPALRARLRGCAGLVGVRGRGAPVMGMFAQAGTSSPRSPTRCAWVARAQDTPSALA